MHSYILVLNKKADISRVEQLALDSEFNIEYVTELDKTATDKAFENIVKLLKNISTDVEVKEKVISVDVESALACMNTKKKELIENVLKDAEKAADEKSKYAYLSSVDMVHFSNNEDILVYDNSNDGNDYLSSLDDFIAYADEEKVKLDIRQIVDYHF